MRKLIKAGLVLGTLLLFVSTAWSLPMVGDTVKMTVNPGYNYGMTVTALGTPSNSVVGDFYNTFCVEYSEHFWNNSNYKVQSVGPVATLGGANTDPNYPNIQEPTTGLMGDPIAQESIWLYASFFDGRFDSVYGTLNKAQLADKVQNAIWYKEDERSDATDYDILTALADPDFTVTGWDIQVVNIIQVIDGKEVNRQSQLVGSPVPEPATMLLLGMGLIGLAGLGRKKIA